MTDAQIKVLEELGFTKYHHSTAPNYHKRYRVYGLVYVFYEANHMICPKNVDTCKEAQRDLARLREEGIV